MTDTTPAFSTDLYIPAYRPGTHGNWSLAMMEEATGTSYWKSYRAYTLQNVALLIEGHGENSQSWMSLTPVEIESSEWGVRPACGHTVITGFGMGWTAVAAACRADVERVTVIERNPQVLGLFEHTLPPDARPPEWDKVRIVHADALSWTPDTPVDFLFADIWPVMGEPHIIADVRRMQANMNAEKLYYWGQELDLVEVAIAAGWDPLGDAPLEDAAIVAARDTLDLPLFLPQPAGVLAEGAWREWCRRMPHWREQRP